MIRPRPPTVRRTWQQYERKASSLIRNDLHLNQSKPGTGILGLCLAHAYACPYLVTDYSKQYREEWRCQLRPGTVREHCKTLCSLCKLNVHPGAPVLGKICWVY